ncbi:unnamed protein product [Rotaria sp. Silwood1]|nr:unnamed protein product [Rotaria sp. Silwood1]CAF1343294.1 unnamed protein product [Rotaria sp. Silwood1]
MNNASIEICSSKLIYNNTLHISYIIWHICGFLCTMIGTPGHLFQILIMSNQTNRKESTSLYHIAIAICELIFLFGVFWLWCVDMSIIKTDPREIFSCGIFYSILIGPTILSNLYLASMSIDQSFMILYPAHHRLLITRCYVLKYTRCNSWDYDNVLHISYNIWRACGFLCAMFGIPGHLFQIVIMSNQTNRKESMSLYFISIGICELIFLFGL